MSRRPIFGWIGFALLVLALVAGAVVVVLAADATADAFLPAPALWAVATTWGGLPVGALGILALVAGIVGVARREKPGWPAIVALILSIPVLGAVVVSVLSWLVVLGACAGPAGACA